MAILISINISESYLASTPVSSKFHLEYKQHF